MLFPHDTFKHTTVRLDPQLEQWLHILDGHFAEVNTGSLAERVKGNF